MHTFTQHRHEPPHYNTTNALTMHVPSHLLIILKSVFDLVHLILHLYFLLANLALWSYFFWLVMLSWTLVPLLWPSLIWTSDPFAAWKNLPPFTIIWLIIPRTHSSHSMKPDCNPPILTITFPHWHPLAFPFWTLHLLLVIVVVLLSFTDHSSKSNHSMLETFLLLYLFDSVLLWIVVQCLFFGYNKRILTIDRNYLSEYLSSSIF